MWSRQHVRLFTSYYASLGCGAGTATSSYDVKENDASLCSVRPATPLGSFFELSRSLQDWDAARRQSPSNAIALLHGHDQITQFSTAPLGSRSPSRYRQSYPKKDARGCCGVLMPVRPHSLHTATVTLCENFGPPFPSPGAFSILRLEVCGRSWQHS